MNALVKFAEGWWWLVLVFGGMVSGTVREALRQRHKRRLAILEAKARLRQPSPVTAAPEDPQPICGCTHHLSFHSPQTGTCAYEGCRCQQYVGPEPLGRVVPLPLVDPDTLSPGSSG